MKRAISFKLILSKRLYVEEKMRLKKMKEPGGR